MPARRHRRFLPCYRRLRPFCSRPRLRRPSWWHRARMRTGAREDTPRSISVTKTDGKSTIGNRIMTVAMEMTINHQGVRITQNMTTR